MNRSLKKMLLSAMFLALGLVLPFFTGQIQQIGNMLCPMHLPVLLCGLLCGWPWGLAVGAMAPLLRSVLFSMPPMFPMAVSMAFELAAYGAVSGWIFQRTQGEVRDVYLALIPAMVIGRLVWGAVRYALAGLTGSTFSFAMFLSGALTTAWPGILLQLILIPPIVRALRKSRLMA